jgi:hypothetical protein
MTLPRAKQQRLTYQGVDGRGVARTGASVSTPAALAESLYERGFRRATIQDGRGWPVAGVGPPLVGTGPREWWGER